MYLILNGLFIFGALYCARPSFPTAEAPSLALLPTFVVFVVLNVATSCKRSHNLFYNFTREVTC